jgi:hypothetical protein
VNVIDDLPKRKAIAAVKACGGDLRQERLRELGLWNEEVAILGQTLEALGLVSRAGHGGGRWLCVPVADAVAALERYPEEALVYRNRVETDVWEYMVLYDPHGAWPAGTQFTAAYMQRLLARDDVSGMEVLDNTGTVWRAYGGRLYEMRDGEMVIEEDASCS